ncbi:MAG: winged helix-turn-helix domain-containing protein [Blastocatellia bacterium]
MSLQTRHFYEFGPYRLDPDERVLFRDGRPLPLPPKTFDTLIALVERSGHIVEKDELMGKVWPDTFVEEVNLARHVSNLRKLLGEQEEDQPYIETVARRGYRFIATVRAVPVGPVGPVGLVGPVESVGSVAIDEGEKLVVETLDHRRLLQTPAGYLDLAPAYSLDGKTLAFIRSQGSSNRDIYLVSTAGGEPRRLTNENRWIDNLAWTADSGEIVFLSGQGPSQAMRRVSLSGGAPEELALGVGNGYDATISRQGNRIAYTQLQSDWNIWRWENPAVSGKRTPPTRLIASTRLDSHPQYSPDGKKIVFTSERSGNLEIWACDSDGSNLARLTQFNGPLLGSPRWAPDSRQIAFDCTAGGVKDIYVVNLDGGPPRRLTTDAGEEVRPSWSRDGKWVYFGSNRTGAWQVWKTPADPTGSGSLVQITQNGGREAFESFDGKFVFYYIDSARSGLWRVPVEGGEEVRVIERAAQGNWALSEQGIYFLDPTASHGMKVQFFNFANGQTRTVTEINRELIVKGPGFSISPDGRWFLCSSLDQNGSDIMLVENFR